jgi:potassium efflux system protein
MMFLSLPLKPRLFTAALAILSLMAPAWSVGAPAASQNTTAQQTQVLPPSLDSAINSALNALPRARDLNADQRKDAEGLLRDALADDKAADDSLAKRQHLIDAAMKAGPVQSTPPVSGSDAGQDFAEWQSKLPDDGNTAPLADQLEIERNQLGTAQASLHDIEQRLENETQRPDSLRDELAGVRGETPANPQSAGDTPPTLTAAMRLRSRAAERLQICRTAELETEQRTYEARMRGLFAQRSSARRSIDEHTQRVRWLENKVLELYTSQTSDLVTQLADARDKLDAAKAPRVLREAAADNLALGQDLIATIKRIAGLRDLANTYSSERSDTEQSAKNTKARLALGDVSEDIGALLLAERHKLQPVSTLNRELADVRNELAQAKLGVIDLREESDRLENMDGAVAATLSRAGQPPAISGPVYEGLQQLLTARADLYTRLIASKSRETSIAEDTERQLSGLIATTRELNSLLDANMLAIPSQAPIDFGWFGDLWRSLRALVRAHETGPMTGVAGSLRSGGALAIAALAILFAAVFARLRVPAELARLAEPLRRIRTDRYRYTTWALVLTLLAAAPIALFWTILARLFLHATHVELLEGSLSLATGSIALPWFVLAFLHWLNREDGLAHAHFRWLRARRTALRRAVPWLALAVIVPTFVHVWLREISNFETDGTIGRALFILGAAVMAGVSWKVLGPGRVWTHRSGKIDDEPIRPRQFSRIVLTVAFIALALLAAFGYFYTAVEFSEHLLMSLLAILAISVVHGLAVRWLILGERRLALKRAEDRQLAETQPTAAVEGDERPEVEPEEVDIADLGAQTRRVLRLFTTLLLGAVLLWIWSDIAPALSFLGNIPLPGSPKDAAGKPVYNLVSALVSALVFAMTFIATRNLPGLLELGVLRRINIDAPTRYAITSIVRYLIVLVGVLSGLNLLGLQWSNLQWLAAGLTVGLGFGLQEIFANFISGLIVLFERPVRIGDTVTIGSVEGTVSRIRTRATTIVDWDNKEVIVPNKTFITERLVNWTLSDTTTRIVIKVGVAYRNDPRLAQKVLIDVAHSHELVLKDPAPLAWMVGFGDSTQDFELRFFVAELGQRNRVRTELQMRIYEAFRANDLELAYPTRDVWFRNPLETNAVASARAKIDEDANDDASSDASRNRNPA